METTIILEYPTRNVADLKFKTKRSYSQKLFQEWEEVTLGDICFEDKILLEKAKEDFKEGRVSSRKKIMRILNK